VPAELRQREVVGRSMRRALETLMTRGVLILTLSRRAVAIIVTNSSPMTAVGGLNGLPTPFPEEPQSGYPFIAHSAV
jgi:hypothetical protein